jgi:protein-S-isoprenylcysteine O-methyltransferase Ste14
MARRFRERGGAWVVGQFVLMLTVLVLGPATQSGWRSALTIAGGLGLLALSALTGIRGVRDLGGNRTPFPRPNDGAPLVTTGIYARLRHPLYASVMLFGFAWGLLWGSTATLGAAGATAAFLHGKARHEERMLRERYPDYEGYARRVKRYVPGVW